MMRGETIDGVWVPGWRLTYWVTRDRIVSRIRRRKEAAWRAAAQRLPRELRKWVIVNAASAVWADENVSPWEITYERMYKAVEPRLGR